MTLQASVVLDRAEKYCPKCDQIKSTDEFGKAIRRYDGFQGWCKGCRAVNSIERKPKIQKQKRVLYNRERLKYIKHIRSLKFPELYGITWDDYERLYQEQNGRCKICNSERPLIGCRKQTSLHVDHCHTTGKVRGLLCVNCNLAIGHLQDSSERAMSAYRYLLGD